jgi:hypothetical protein
MLESSEQQLEVFSVVGENSYEKIVMLVLYLNVWCPADESLIALGWITVSHPLICTHKGELLEKIKI